MKNTFMLAPVLLLALLPAPPPTNAVKLKVVWGAEEKASRRATLSDVLGHDDAGIYTLRNEGFAHRNSILHYNMAMNQTAMGEMDLKEGRKYRDYEFTLHLKDRFHVFTSFRDQKSKINRLFRQTMDKKTLRLNPDSKVISEIDYAHKPKWNAGNFSVSLSNDKSRVLVYYNKPYEREEFEKFGFHLLDDEMNTLWQKDIVLPYEDGLFTVVDYRVSNSGNVFLLGKLYAEKHKESRKGNPNYKYMILGYYNKGEDLKEFQIDVQGKFLKAMQIEVRTNGDIICAGFYSTQEGSSIQGCYYLRLDGETQKIAEQNFKDFGLDFITMNMTEREERKAMKKAEKGKDVELFQFALDDLVLRDDGGAVLVGEQYYVRSHTVSSFGPNGSVTTYTTYTYFYNDIIVINIAPDGTIAWAKKIGKRQVTKDDGGYFSSYALAVVKDKLYFVFNDNAKNLNYKGDGKPDRFSGSRKESVVMLVAMDHEGNQTRQSLFSAKEAEVMVRPKVCEQISEDEMVLFGEKGKTHRFARITFED